MTTNMKENDMNNFNPFEECPIPIEKTLMDWNTINSRPYNKYETNPYTKCRIVLMNGTEFEAQWFSRNFARHCADSELRQQLALVRRSEQQQQKRISTLKPLNETILEHTITYEQLAVDLTAVLAKQETNCDVINALNFALLEDFDHLYRYSNLLDMEYGTDPKKLVGGYTEITPARPTMSEHRHPLDSIFPHTQKNDCIQTKLNVNIITAAEQQTMNYYMNVAPLYEKSDLGRRLYVEIGLIEEEHVSQYESLIDPNATWLENLLLHEYTECYLYYSCMLTECDPRIRCIWEDCLTQEISHLHKAKDLLYKYEHKEWQQVIPDGTFPSILKLRPNIEYVRNVIATTTGNTQCDLSVVPLHELCENARFYWYQNLVNNNLQNVASHNVIDRHIRCKQIDYRYEVAPNPLEVLRNRRCDNTTLARNPKATPESTTICGTTENHCRCDFEPNCGEMTPY